jgi:hypothetical protein
MPESDSAGSVFTRQPKSLAALLEASAERSRLWRTDELGAIFRHQMSAPVLVDLGGFDPGTAQRLKSLSDAQSLLLKSFGDLFHHPAPPLELLELTKTFAKANMDHPDSSLPGEVAAALYYTSIAAALVRLNARITRLKDADLGRGLLWTRDQAWPDDDTKRLLGQAAAKLAPPGAGEVPAP